MRRSTIWIALVALVAVALPATANDGGHPMLKEINDTLEAMGMDVRVEYAEYITSDDGPEFGNTVYANDRGNKQLGSDWVPGDPRRYGVNEIYWTTDQVDLTADVSDQEQNDAISRAMATWQEVQCSSIPLVQVEDGGLDLGYVEWLLGFGGIPGWVADLSHAGWLPASFFDALADDGSTFILGVTFTFTWTGPDMDGNGKSDVAFREIYYNDNFNWAIGGSVDVESIALHEVGHGLSQAHFGKVFVDNKGNLKFAPKAVMNAVYTGGTEHVLTGTDVGGHCSNWGSWPNN